MNLSVIVVPLGGGVFLQRCLRSLVSQADRESMEILVPLATLDEKMKALQKEFSHVQFLELGEVATEAPAGSLAARLEQYDRWIAAGLCHARGRIVALLQDYGIPDPDWCAQVLQAHELPHGVIGGAVENVRWAALPGAVYLFDFARFQLPLPEGPCPVLTDANVSYKRGALESVRHVWKDRYQEAIVNQALADRGVVLWLRPQIVVRQNRTAMDFRQSLRERFGWGRFLGSSRGQKLAPGLRWARFLATAALPAVLLFRIFRYSLGHRRGWELLRAFPALASLTLAWSLGEGIGYLTGREAS